LLTIPLGCTRAHAHAAINDGDGVELFYPAINDDEGIQPSDKYLEEVQEYFQLSRDSLNREARQAVGGESS
jgi:hypothetical protein